MKTIINIGLVFTIIFVISTQQILFAQNTLKSDVIEFMGKYKKFSSFTEDGLNYNKDFEKEFKALFERGKDVNKNYQVFNDVDTTHKPPYISKEKYINLLKGYFPKGINVDIRITSIGKPKNVNAHTNIIVDVKKKMLGLNKNGKIIKMDYNLSFKLKYRKKLEKGKRLKIISIDNRKYPRETTGFNMGLNVVPGYTRITSKEYLNKKNENGTWHQTGEPSFQAGLEVNHYFKNENYGFGARINYVNYRSTYTIDEVKQMDTLLSDIDKDTYYLVSSGASLKEEASVSWISIPVFFKYRYVLHKSKWLGHIYFNVGPEFSFIINQNFETSSKFTYKGYYPEYHVMLENIEEYGFEENYENKTATESDIKSFNLSLLAEAGVNIPLNNKLNFNFSVLFEKGLLNLSNQNDDYIFTIGPDNQNSLLDSRNKVSTLFFGFNIGLMYKLF